VLRKSGVLADISAIGSDNDLFEAIAAIPGQASGISLEYCLMLAGYSGFTKPDRMVPRFVAGAS